ncbi:hypothetical protein C4D60_Mb09t02170 [Musa balbisiana]|uniref:Uncharacterized protein n=1 Tax=Musa balbisiana TaxID=52838 RepID=A0A4S8IER5_MUSBA|nr:hypothetical protein C4D60_Mb09t02170 [Musa balbisiana]
MNAASSTAPPVLLPSHQHRLRRASLVFSSLVLKPRPPLSISSSLFGHRRRRPPDPKSSSHDRNLELTIDPGTIAARASAAAVRLRRSSEESLRRFLSAGEEAYHDLRTSVRVDRSGNRVVFSCRESSLLFVSNLFLWSFVAVLVARALVWLGLGFRSRWRFGDWAVIRRDRSLGGREVVVGRSFRGRDWNKKSFPVSRSPLSPVRGTELKTVENVAKIRREKQEKLPKWWPDLIPAPVIATGKQDYQREVDRLVNTSILEMILLKLHSCYSQIIAHLLVSVILDYRMSGKDYRYDDIIQLREICKVSGARASFETANARDSFYRASVDFVLNSCSRAIIPSDKPRIGGEDVRQFIAGLAVNIGLTNSRAITLVSAAVAARTRSCFLQCWAFEVQGKRTEALEELLKICLIHRTFPPEEHSAEMEMVGSGLKRHLTIEQRKHLLSLYKETCAADDHKSIEEALGLRRPRPRPRKKRAHCSLQACCSIKTYHFPCSLSSSSPTPASFHTGYPPSPLGSLAMAAFRLLFLLGLCLCLSSLVSSKSADFMALTLVWPGAQCTGDILRICCKPSTGVPARDFQVQAMETYDSNGKLVKKCSICAFSADRLSNLLPMLHDYWSDVSCPSNDGVNQWQSAWCTYGTCSSLTQVNYFARALELRAEVDLLSLFSSYGIVPTKSKLYGLETIKGVLASHFGASTWVECNINTLWFLESQLYKIHICVAADGSSIIDCPVTKRSNCGDTVRFVPFPWTSAAAGEGKLESGPSGKAMVL